MPRLLGWIGIAGLLLYLVFVGGGWQGIYTSNLRVITMSLAGGLLAAWGLLAWRSPEWRPRSVLMPAILACLASLAISTGFSRVPRVSLEYLGYSIVLAALYLFLVRLFASPFFRPRLVALGALLFVAISIEAIVATVWLWIGWWDVVGRVTLPPLRPYFLGLSWGNPSAILTIVALFAVPAAAAAWSRPRRRAPALLAILLLVGIVALLSGSRAGWLALAVTAIVGAGLAAWSLRSRPVARIVVDWVRAGGPLRRLGLFVAGTGLVGLGAFLLPGVLRRVAAGGDELRGIFAVVALRLFGESPLVGTGPGSWTIERIATTQAGEIDYYVPHAHDVPVQVLGELGLLGTVAGVVLVVMVARLLLSAYRGGGANRRPWAVATALGLLYFGLHQILDSYANMPAILFAASLPVAYLDATEEPNAAATGRWRRLPQRLGRWPGLVAGGLVAVAVVGLLVQEIPAGRFDDAVTAARSGNWQAAREPTERAAREDPKITPYAFVAGLAAARAGDHPAAAAYFSTVALRDDLPEAWLDLAAEQAQFGRTSDALDSIRHALRLGSQRPDVGMAAGDLALRLGDRDLAVDAFAAAFVEVPSLAGDGWWKSDELHRDVLAQSVEEAITAGGSATGWEIALMAGDGQQARKLAAGMPDGPLATLVIDAWVGDADAARQLYARCEANVLDQSVLPWCARIASHAGDAGRAERYRLVSEGISPGSSVRAVEVRVALDDGTAGTPLPAAAAFWGRYTYRRPAEVDILVAGLIHLTLE